MAQAEDRASDRVEGARDWTVGTPLVSPLFWRPDLGDTFISKQFQGSGSRRHSLAPCRSTLPAVSWSLAESRVTSSALVLCAPENVWVVALRYRFGRMSRRSCLHARARRQPDPGEASPALPPPISWGIPAAHTRRAGSDGSTRHSPRSGTSDLEISGRVDYNAGHEHPLLELSPLPEPSGEFPKTRRTLRTASLYHDSALSRPSEYRLPRPTPSTAAQGANCQNLDGSGLFLLKWDSARTGLGGCRSEAAPPSPLFMSAP